MIKKIIRSTSLLLAFAGVTLQSQAAMVEVNPSDPMWGTTDTNSYISDVMPRNGNGSLELHGDRTRYFGLGSPFDASSNLGLLSDLVDFNFDWLIDGDSVSALGPDYTPALRLHVWDGSQRSEIIWEGAYNGTYGNTNRDTWYSTDFDDNFWQYISGVGVTPIYNRTIDDWKGIYSSSAYISSVSIGVGSSAGNDYLAYADNLTLQFANQESRTFNFETQATDVPAPQTLALFALSLVALVRFKRAARK